MTVKILQILGGGKRFTGIASYLYQQYKHINHNKVHYDFLFELIYHFQKLK